MNDSDKNDFKDLMGGLTEYYQSFNPKLEPLTRGALQVFFGSLRDYAFDEVAHAAERHVADKTVGQFFPSAGNLIKQLDGGEITPDMIIAAAKLAETPLGCLSRIQIGSWDLDNRDGFYLRQRAMECLQKLPEWKSRAACGEYTDHEISIMLKHNVSPLEPLFIGIPAPSANSRLKQRQEAVRASDRHLMLISKEEDYSLDHKADNSEASKAISAITDNLRLDHEG